MANILGTSGNNPLTGTGDDDNIRGRGGQDTISAGAGNDFIQPDDLPPAIGSDTIDGGAGVDTLLLFGNFADYTITFSGANILLTRGGVTETVTGVEVISFDDTLVRVVGVGSEYATIQSAVDAANVTTFGDTILVAPGTYTEQVVVDGKDGISIIGANFGVPGDGDRAAESSVIGNITISSDGITIDGMHFDGGQSAIRGANGAEAYDNLTIKNNLIENTTDSAIRFGLGSGGGIGSENWTITGNKISDVAGNNLTGMVLFNIDGLTVTDNVINHDDPAFTGRRGINLDGVLNATVTGNTVNMGLVAPTDATVANTASPWAIQISMSDRAVENLTVSGNTVSGANSGIIGLSQRSMVNVDITGNTVSDVVSGIVLNTGGVAPVAPGVTMDVDVTGNTITAAVNAIFVRDLHDTAANGPVTFTGLEVAGNTVNAGVVQIGRLESSQPTADGLVNITGATTIDGSGNGDTVRVEGAGAVTFNGGEGADTFIGGDGADIINADGGNDTITGGGGSDTIDGGAGSGDTAVFSGAVGDYTISYTLDANGLVTGFNTVTDNASGAVDTLNGIEIVQIGATTLTAGAAVQVFDGVTLVGTFSTIQAAVTAASAGNTVRIGAGTYDEQVTIDKSLTILGANATVDPTGAGMRGPETIIADTDGRDFMFLIDASDVTIKGLTFAGLAGGGTFEAITSYTGPGLLDYNETDRITIENNIIENIGSVADYGYAVDFGGSAVSSDIVITNNVFQDMPNANGVIFYGNAYGDITDNVFRDVDNPIYVGNQWIATDGTDTTPTVSGNDIETSGAGIFINNNFGNPTPFTVSGNTISDGDAGAQNGTGIVIWSLAGGAGVVIENNDVTGMATGVEVWNAAATITGGTLDGNAVGVLATDTTPFGATNASATIAGTTISNSTTAAVQVSDASAAPSVPQVIFDAVTPPVLINNATDAIVTGTEGAFNPTTFANPLIIQGDAASNTFTAGAGNESIDGQGGIDTVLYEDTLAPTDIAASGGGWTVTAATEGTDTLTSVERITDGAGNTFLLVGNGGYVTIQAAVDAAPDNAVIIVAAGTYAEQVIIDGKTGLTLVEAGGDVTIVMPAVFQTNVAGLGATPVVAVYNSTDVTLTGITVDGNRAFTGGPISFFIGIDINASTDVTVDGVTVTGTRSPEATDPLWTGTDLFGLQDGFSIYAYQSENVTIQNSTFQDSQKGHIIVQEVTGTVVIDNNTIVGVGADGRIAQNGIEVFDVPGGATVTNNDVTGISYTDNPAGGFDAFATTGIFLSNAPGSTVSGNTVTAPPASGEVGVEDGNGRQIGIYVDDSDGTTVSSNTITGLPGAEDHSGIVVVDSADIVLSTNTFTDLSVALATNNSTGPAGASLDGTPFVDFLTGGAGNETIDGLASADTIDGAGGDDTLIGGAGSDTLIGGDGIDTIVLAGSFADYVPSFGTGGELILTNLMTGDVETITRAEVLDFETGPDVRLVNVAGGGYATIQAAIDAAAAPGEIVFVGAGAYSEDVNVSKHVNLFGLDDTVTVLNGSVTISASGADAANRTTVQGFGITGGVVIGDVDHVGLFNVALSNGSGPHVVDMTFAGTATDITITDALINATGTQSGLHVGDATTVTDLVIKDTTFAGGQFGIYLENDDGVAGDTVSGRFEGLTFDGQSSPIPTGTGDSSRAIYAEKLSDATLSDITVNAPVAPANDNLRGINLNLKDGGSFANIAIDGVVFNGFTTAAATGTLFNPLLVVGVKPGATLDGITINNVTASKLGGDASGSGLTVVSIFAEAGAANITGLSVTNSTLGGNVSISTSDYVSIDGNTVTGDLSLNFVNQPASPGNSLAGNTVSGLVTFTAVQTTTLPDGADNLVLIDGTPFGLPTNDIDGTGNDGDNAITGNSGINVLTGGGGVDSFMGGLGNDSIDGGADSDVAIYAGNRADYAITYATSGGVVTGFASITNIATGEVDTLANIETLRFGDGDLTVDMTAPTATVAIDATALKIGETAQVTVTFSEAVTGFSNADVEAENGMLSTFATTDGGVTWTATFTPNADVTDTSNIVTLADASYTDIPGNAGSGAVSGNYAIDTKAPTATIEISDAALKSGETATVTVTFSEAVDGFSNDDVTVENGTLGTLTTADGGVTWTATFTPDTDVTDASNVITLAATYTDIPGNDGTGAVSSTYAIDTDNPGVAINTIEGDDIVNAFEAVNGVQITGTSDLANGSTVAVSISGGAAFNATVNNGTWTLTRPAPADGSHIITASATDPAGNTTSTTRTIVVDRVAPTISIATVEGNGLVNAVEVADGVQITGTTTAEDGQEVTVFVNDAETLSAIAAGGMWTVTSTASTNGAYTVRATVADRAGNASNEATGSFTIDTVPPTVELLASGVEGGDLNISAIEVRDGVELTGTVEAGATVEVNGETALVTGTTWTVTIPIPPQGGTVPVTVVATDPAGNTATATLNLETAALGVTEFADNLVGTPDADTINLLGGNDTYFGDAGGDDITGGLGADDLDGGAGDDTFRALAGDIIAGESIDGGADTDTLALGAGSHSLVGVTLSDLESITLAAGPGPNTLTLGSADQAVLVTAAPGDDDTVAFDGNLDFVTHLLPLAAAGVEHVQFTNANGTNVANFEAGVLDSLDITYLPTDTLRDTGRVTFDPVTLATTSIQTVFDGGLDETLFFENGQRTRDERIDGGDQFTWETQTFAYTNGVLATLTQSNDDGTGFYAEYGVGGAITRNVNTQVDGDTYDIRFDATGTQLVQTITTDVSNTETFDTFTNDFTNGVFSRSTTVFDNDVRTVSTFDPATGRQTKYEQFDDGDVFAYDSLVNTFANDGSLVSTVFTLDDGSTSQLAGPNGATLTGTGGNDSMSGSVGDADTFVFAPAGGRDFIANFENDVDTIDLQAFNFTDVSQVQAIASAGTGVTFLQFSDGTFLTINGLNKADLDVNDVIL